MEARWLSRRIDDLRRELILPIVRALDDAINNTSLILLFEVGTGDDRRLMLFPGDAQIENWAYSLTGPDAHQWADLLADVDLYKVGHHGSLNATPKDKPLEQIRQARAGQRSRADDAPLYARRRPRGLVDVRTERHSLGGGLLMWGRRP